MAIPFQTGDVLLASDLNKLALKPVVQSAIPSTGTTVIVNSGTTYLVLNPTVTLSSLTVQLPTPPTDGQLLVITSTQTITTLALTNGTTSGTPTTISTTSPFTIMYVATLTKWIKVG